jgi:hypothetical protein
MFSFFGILPFILLAVAVLAVIGLVSFINNMKNNNMDANRIGTAKDFFIQVGAIVTFYASVIALITLLFEVINFAYPKITNGFYYATPSISFQVATLIVAFPLFLLLSHFLQKSYAAEPMLRESLIRRWLAYITLFVAGGVVAGDLVTVIYMYLDGQELATGFILKVLTLLVIAGGVFFYYLREIRNTISPRERNIWRVVAAIILVGSIVLGFSVMGSPRDQRERRYDQQRVNDLQGLQWQVINYWQQKERLPQTIEDLKDPLSGNNLPIDPETQALYEYEKTGNLSFRLCANFYQPTPKYQMGADSMARPMYGPEVSMRLPEVWNHEAGRQCFDRTIDPDLYPPYERVRS